MSTTVSVVVCTRNRGDDLLSLLDSLVSQTRRPDEVVIVDASDRPLLETEHAKTIEASPLTMKVFHAEPGLTRQRNLGVRESYGDLVFFFDDDVVLEPDFIAEMVRTFDRYPEYHGGMGTVKGTTLRPWSPGSILTRIFLLPGEGDGRFAWSGAPRHPYGSDRFRDVEVLGGCVMAFRRSVFTEDRLEFDERLTGYASQEDVDFSWRVSRRHRLFFNPRARLDHRRSAGDRPSVFERSRMFMVNFRYLYFKNVYPSRPWTLPAHWWALLGLFVVAGAGGAPHTLRGYWAGLCEFRKTFGR